MFWSQTAPGGQSSWLLHARGSVGKQSKNLKLHSSPPPPHAARERMIPSTAPPIPDKLALFTYRLAYLECSPVARGGARSAAASPRWSPKPRRSLAWDAGDSQSRAPPSQFLEFAAAGIAAPGSVYGSFVQPRRIAPAETTGWHRLNGWGLRQLCGHQKR